MTTIPPDAIANDARTATGTGAPSDARAEADGRVCLGVVTGAHGVHGRLRIKSFTADAYAIASYGALSDEAGERTFTLRITGETRGQLIAEMDGVKRREGAEALRGTRLYVPRAALPSTDEDEFYHADLIGLAVTFDGDESAGRVVDVHDFGAGTMLEIAPESGVSGSGLGNAATVLVPFTREAVPTVDVARGHLVVTALPGLLGDASEKRDGADEAPETRMAATHDGDARP